MPLLLVDSEYYKKFTFAPWNLLKYNVFGSERGPDLYGTEPWYFYLFNGIINFNIVFVAALVSLPIIVPHINFR